MLTGALLTGAKRRKQATWTDEWIHTREADVRKHYSDLKRQAFLLHVTYTNTEGVVSEIRKSQRQMLYGFTYMRYLEESNSETESRVVAAGRKREQGATVNGQSFSSVR